MTFYILAAALVASTGLSVTAWLLLAGWKARVRRCERELAGLKDDLRALCAGAVGTDERLARLENRGRRLVERQEQLELRDQGDRQYAPAIRMVQKGASIDELVSVCGISRGEAELISMMHRLDEAS
jgi:hypothetical protein